MKIKNRFLRGAMGALITIFTIFSIVALVQGAGVILGVVGEMIKIYPLRILVFVSIILVAVIWSGIQIGNDFFNNNVIESTDKENGGKNGQTKRV